jgi:hypothetical protein
MIQSHELVIFYKTWLFWITNKRHTLTSTLCKSSLFQARSFGMKRLIQESGSNWFFCHNNNSWTMWWLTSMWGLTILYVGMFEFVKHWLYIMDSREVEPFSYMLIVDWFHVIDYVTLEIIIRHSRNKFSE